MFAYQELLTTEKALWIFPFPVLIAMFSLLWLAGHALLIISTRTGLSGAKMQQNVVSAIAVLFFFFSSFTCSTVLA